MNEAGFGTSIELDPKIQNAICTLRSKDLNFGFDISAMPKEYSPSSGNLVLTGEQLASLFEQLKIKWKQIPKGQGEKVGLIKDRAEAANVFGKYLNAVGQKKDFAQQQFTIKCPN